MLPRQIRKSVNVGLASPFGRCYTSPTTRNNRVEPDLEWTVDMKVILDAEQIAKTLLDLVREIADRASRGGDPVIIGVRSRGEILAQRLAGRLAERLGRPVPCGTLDITLYRDDLNAPHSTGHPLVQPTEIGFDIDDKTVILVDDVLHTGRSVRAALSALIDLGRPKAIRLAVLVERGGREFPIQADYIGYRAEVEPGQVVQVNLIESDGKDEVVVE